MTDIERGLMLFLAKEVKADPVVRELVGIVTPPPLEPIRESVWTLAIYAYVKGHIAGSNG
jgi:hypothetical protein